MNATTKTDHREHWARQWRLLQVGAPHAKAMGPPASGLAHRHYEKSSKIGMLPMLPALRANSVLASITSTRTQPA
jgi:hypothetical protein